MSKPTARAIPGALLAALLAVAAAAQAPQTPAPYTVVSPEGRRPLPARVINGQEMFPLDDLARLFTLAVKEDPIAGGLTITVRNQTILLSPNQEIASVGGRLVSLPSPPARDGGAWFVPVDFVARALAPVAGTPIELRKPSRLVLVGSIRMPRVAGRVEPLGNLARVTLDVAPATPHTVTQEGGRLLVRFQADALDAALPATTAPDLVQAVRPEGATAIAIELGPRFTSFRATDLPGDRGGGRIVIEVVAAPTETPGAPAAPATPPAEAPPLLDLAPPGSLRTIVIDPGHGGADEGAHGPGGATEKSITMATARRLKASLEARLGVRVILTRDGDTAIGLDERAAVANNNKADLFVSLHANASIRPAASGAEVFYLSLDEYGEEAARAASASAALPVFGGGVRDIEVVPWRMAQARHIERSGGFARDVEAALRGRVPMSPRALMQAPLRVLVGANMPAVLVEMGFITNPEQEKRLVSAEYQNDVVQSVVDAVIRFRDSRGAAPAPQEPAR